MRLSNCSNAAEVDLNALFIIYIYNVNHEHSILLCIRSSALTSWINTVALDRGRVFFM